MLDPREGSFSAAAAAAAAAADFCFFSVAFIAAFDPELGFDFILLCPFFGAFDFTGLSLSFSVGDGDFFALAPAPSISKTALKKSGSPRSSVSSLRSPAAPSLSAWLVFSIAFLSPISDLITINRRCRKWRQGVFVCEMMFMSGNAMKGRLYTIGQRTRAR